MYYISFIVHFLSEIPKIPLENSHLCGEKYGTPNNMSIINSSRLDGKSNFYSLIIALNILGMLSIWGSKWLSPNMKNWCLIQLSKSFLFWYSPAFVY
jgi:hypothetical protein